jgi:hypothetical protein
MTVTPEMVQPVTSFFATGMGNANVASTGSLYHRVVSGAYFNSSAFRRLEIVPQRFEFAATDAAELA